MYTKTVEDSLQRRRSYDRDHHMSIMDFDLPPKFYEEQDGMSSDIIHSLPWRHFPTFKHR